MTRCRRVAVFVPHLACPHRCSFCDQRRISGTQRPPTPGEVAGLLRRAAAQLDGPAEIAFFGGSFTAVEPAYMEALLQAAQPFLRDGPFTGIRVSTRPDGVNGPVLDKLRRYGVTAVELGAQSMDDGVLERCGRGHTARDVERAAALVRDRGLWLGLQMMTGLPGDTPAGARRTARQLAALGPHGVRIYPTLVLRGTALEQQWWGGRYTPQSLDDAVTLCAGLLHYFHKRHIPVIRLGLHAEQSLEESRVAGPYHPAFRELCESRQYLRQALAQIRKQAVPPGPLQLTVAPNAASKMAGQHRANLRLLEQRGYHPKIRTSPTLGYLEVEATTT